MNLPTDGISKTEKFPWQVDDMITMNTGAYQVMDIKGGGMGQVYICIHEESGIPYALKTFQEKFCESQAVIDRFRWEAEVWVRLGRHKNIVRADVTGESKGYVFVVLEYVVGDEHYGSDLSDWIKKGGLSIPLSLDFACQFCTGMIHAKESFESEPSLTPPFVHRDIKPANIMVTKDRIVKVTDFGLVKAFKEDIEVDLRDDSGDERYGFTKMGSVCGTFPYIAPEIWRGEEPDERSDIYSFGCVLYEMFSSVPPFYYPDKNLRSYYNAHTNLSPKTIRDIPDGINELVFKCLKKERDDRYQDFKILRDDLAELYYEQPETEERLIFREETEAEWEEIDLVNKGVGLANLGFHKEALEYYNKALSIKPKYALAYNNRGLAYYKLGEYTRAIEDYNQALSINPKDALAYLNRGSAYSALGEYNRAIEDYNQALSINPKLAEAYYNRGLAYYALGEYNRAIEDCNQAISINPKYAEAYLARGVAYYALGEYNRAIEDYNQAISINPKDALAYLNRGSAYSALGEYTRAIEDYNQAISIKPKLAEAYYNSGNAYYYLGEYTRAIEDYNQAISIKPKDALAYYNRGLAYSDLGEYTRAIEDYQKFIEFAPSGYASYVEQARQFIRELQCLDGSSQNTEIY